ncbi:proton-conducting transporter membrane subunit [Frankia sp. Cj5]|uniref:proton-conducting transporter transmembrane domain-containing protein n=1 Tax=Frankia sp. Cj5 TaxID=2880978 RepID=UPI001EF58C88|nr:proton-conducting transporter membrane subunit [Frankia sp. Cj5]
MRNTLTAQLSTGANSAVGTALLPAAVALPAAGVAGQALALWFGHRRSERATVTVVAIVFGAVALATAVLGLALLVTGRAMIDVRLGTWFASSGHAWRWRLVADRLSVPFALSAATLIGLIGALSSRYLHREPGFFRFYLLLTLFGTGTELVVLAGSLAVVFVGWELVGLSSALLIAFFHERRGPVRHGLRAFLTYRACDVGLLAGTALLAGAATSVDLVGPPVPATGWTSWTGELGRTDWAQLPVPGSAASATLVALLLLLAVVGKSALVPASGWLPRAMEGPTPSSAICYGAISVHLGPYLLLRSHALLDAAPAARAVVVFLGLATALHATLVGRVQSDIKNALAYASMTQVGLIVAEIGLGLDLLAALHILGHAAVRGAQILRSPSLLHDRHHLEQAMGRTLPHTGRHLERLVPGRWQLPLYRYALGHGYLDVWLRRLGAPIARLLHAIDQAQRRVADRIGGARGGTTTETARLGLTGGSPSVSIPAVRHAARQTTAARGTGALGTAPHGPAAPRPVSGSAPVHEQAGQSAPADDVAAGGR